MPSVIQLFNRMRKLLATFSAIQTEDGQVLQFDGDELQVGVEIFLNGSPAPTGEYKANGKIVKVTDGVVTDMTAPEPSELECAPEKEECECDPEKEQCEELPEEPKEEPKEAEKEDIPAPMEEVPGDVPGTDTAIESRLQSIEEQLKKLSDAVFPVVQDSFSSCKTLRDQLKYFKTLK